jgi:hypothetical protein
MDCRNSAVLKGGFVGMIQSSAAIASGDRKSGCTVVRPDQGACAPCAATLFRSIVAAGLSGHALKKGKSRPSFSV